MTPFVAIIAFMLVTNALMILRWSSSSSTDDAANDIHPENNRETQTPPLDYTRRLRLPLYHTTSKSLSRNVSGIIARVFEPTTLPCFPAEHRWYGQHVLTSQTSTGILFNKPFKTASSTTVGVQLRIAKNLARRNNQNNQWKVLSAEQQEHAKNLLTTSNTLLDYSMCQMRFDHGLARDLYPHRDKQHSFLWTSLRDPTSRAISQFFHFMVGRHKMEPTDVNFQMTFEKKVIMTRDYYLYILSTSNNYHSRVENNPLQTAQAILNDYDFIAITERLDESLVVLQLLLNLSTADILYLSAKHNGHFDDGAGKKKCFYIWPSFVTPSMQTYFASPQWQDDIQYDMALYQAANRSLDLTIEAIGRQKFEKQLQRFQMAQSAAKQNCLPTAIFPCSEGGQWRPHNTTNCLWNDSGCGNDCLDEVADELSLW